MDNKYVKIVYQTPPIGERKIVLYLTTFDLDAYKKDHKVKYKEEAKVMPIENEIEKPSTYGELCTQTGRFAFLEYEINNWVKAHYQPLIEALRVECERCRPVATWNNAKNISNADDVYCDIVEGNITNCNDVYCNVIKGNVVNCDRIIYRGDKGNEDIKK